MATGSVSKSLGYIHTTITDTTYFNKVDCARDGNIVTILLSGPKNIPAGGWNALYTLGADYRPRQQEIIDCIIFSDNLTSNPRVLRFSIATNGTISTYNYSTLFSSSNQYCRLVYIAS